MTVVSRSLLIALAIVASAAGTARAGTLDPFRHHAAQHQTSLDPFRLAQAAPAPGTTAPVAAPSPAPSCRSDDDCSGERYCDAGSCKPIGTRTNIAYLYYREGSFREILLLY